MTGRVSPRWAFLEGLDIGTDGDPYLDRLRIVQTPWFGVYLHHIHRPDRDRHPHDHPWFFASLVLAGSYEESVWPDKRSTAGVLVRRRRRFSAAALGRDAAHIITTVKGPLWTLVLTGPRRAEWGFWVQGEFVPWRKYIAPACRHCGQPIERCKHDPWPGSSPYMCKGWRHVGYDDQPMIGHCCEGRSINPVAEPAEEGTNA